MAPEQRIVLYDVPWWQYLAMRDTLAGVRMAYREGTLELMKPSPRHEDVKTLIARLIEGWALMQRVDLRGYGGATFRRDARLRGIEPDECYKLGKLDEDGVPDIAIDVQLTPSLIDKLDIYASLGVREVWVWTPDAPIAVHRLANGKYTSATASQVVPQLDLGVLSRFVKPGENQTELVIAYRASLRA